MGTQKAPSGYQPTGQAKADAGYQSLVSNATPWATGAFNAIPSLQTAATNVQNNPFNLQALQGAQATAQYGQTLAPQQQAAATGQFNMANQVMPYATSILQTGFDPQQALYNRTQEQVTQQQNAINAQSGVASTPYGAGVTGQTNANFNIDWQNNQLARELQAIQGYGSAANTAGTSAATGSQLGQDAMSTLTGAAGQPAATYAGQQGQTLDAFLQMLSGTNSAFGPTQALTGDLAQYLGLGQSATGLAQSAAQINNNSRAQMMKNIMAAIDTGGSFFGVGPYS